MDGAFKTTPLNHALELAGYGWHVFPAPPGKKQGYEKGENHEGRRWGATNDVEKVTQLFAKWPNANLGIATQPSGLMVIDCDIKPEYDGVEWLADQIEQHGEWPETVEALSPSGSWHIYFQYPDDFDPKNSVSEIAPGVDVRGYAGMVIAPPSVKPGEEKAYRWKNPPGQFDVAPAPRWLLDMVPHREAESKSASSGKFADNGSFEDKAAKLSKGLQQCSIEGQKHEGVRTVASMLGQRGLGVDLISAVIHNACPVWDDNVENLITSAYDKYAGNNFRHNSLDLIRDSKERPIWNVQNAMTLLKEHSDWQGVLGYNEYRARIEIQNAMPGSNVGDRDLDDNDYTEVQAWFNRNGFPKAGKQIAIDATRAVAAKNTFNPLTCYLNSLKWDGTARLGMWLIDYCGAENTQYIREVGARWMISAVARAMRPGCKVDTMLVLEGPQGVKKSTAVRTLAGEGFYGDDLPDMTTKDAKQYVSGKWIIEVAELVATKRDQEAVKAFISRQIDDFRRPYGIEDGPRPRQCVFIGTTNQDSYLRDETGNRRFWPVKVDHIDIDMIARMRDQLWAEAVHHYKKGSPWWLTDDVETAAREVQAARIDVDVWVSDIAEYVEDKTEISPREILCKVIAKDVKEITRTDSDRVVRSLKTLGFERDGRVKSGHFKGQARYVNASVMPQRSG